MGYGGHMKNLPPQICWGNESEERARKCYIENRKDVGELMEVLPSGLPLMPERAYLGASKLLYVEASPLAAYDF